MASPLFHIYLPSRHGPECILPSSIDSVDKTFNTSEISSTVISSINYSSRGMVQVRPERPFNIMTSSSNSILNETSMAERSVIHSQQINIASEQDQKNFRLLNQYVHFYNRSFSRTPCAH